MKTVLIIQPIHAEALALLEARSDIAYSVATDLSEAALIAAIAEADAVTVRDALLSPAVIAAAPKLKVVSRHGVGYDNIPVQSCTALGIPVCVVGPVTAASVAEQTLLLMLAAARRTIALDAAVRAGDFSARNRIGGLDLRGRRLLLIGFGRIGREVAVRALAFGMRVRVFDPNPAIPPQAPIEAVASLTEGLREADVVSLHVPLSSGTRRMLGAEELALLPKGAIVVNASRGGLVDEDALLAAVQAGRLHGAGLDTFEQEPLGAGSALLAEPRIVLSPHSAALTEDSLIAMGVATVRNALAALDGVLDPALVVNREALAQRRGDPT